nr:PREDICTED: catechol O-methyltransferase-like isoform X1 [Lepisosteus oculatus]XP_015205297.1 PREDICTED: catechol O-methyltransferase-like isoform X1 [Lepisosteus oculatus]
MWLPAVYLPLIPVFVAMAIRYREQLGAFCRNVFFGRAGKHSGTRVQRAHDFVLMNSTHGQPDSVLQTFDLYAETQPSLVISREKGEFLDEVVRKATPACALVLGTQCGYSAIRILRLLPPSSKLYTVEQDPSAAEAAEEMILVAGFKHSQFQMVGSPSAVAIPQMLTGFDVRAVGLVLMDHDVEQYLPDLQALEKEGLLSTGCTLLVNNIDLREAQGFLHYIHSSPQYSVVHQVQDMLEIQCHQCSVKGTDPVTL